MKILLDGRRIPRARTTTRRTPPVSYGADGAQAECPHDLDRAHGLPGPGLSGPGPPGLGLPGLALPVGEYRTKRVVLEIYDAMQVSIATGETYRTLLDLPPADPGCCHPPKEHQ